MRNEKKKKVKIPDPFKLVQSLTTEPHTKHAHTQKEKTTSLCTGLKRKDVSSVPRWTDLPPD